MLTFISSQLLFYAAIALVLFVPGYFLVLATRLNKEFSSLELFVAVFGSSIIAVDFLMIILGRSPLHITRLSVLGAIVLFSAICYAVYFFRRKKNPSASGNISTNNDISRGSAVLIILLLLLTIFIKTVYFKDTAFPTTTDLGHHMYWAKAITVTGDLPVYEKAGIGPDLAIGKPAPIADFIIGEHLIFAAISLVSGMDFISAFPSLVLFLIHMMSILAVFVLTRSVFKKLPQRDAIAIMALFLIGPLYALASPQAKFISGGVIGNTIGNLFIPLAFLFYLRAFAEKKSALLAWALSISLGLAYTHHLSTLVFVFIALFGIIFFAALNFRTMLAEAKTWVRLFVSPPALAVLAMGIVFVFFLYTPTYLNPQAIDTAVGAPSKASRNGLTLTQFKTTMGEARTAFAVAGLALLFFARGIGRYGQALTIGWMVALTAMSLRPDWLFLDIPSNRIASYVVFPAAVIAAYAAARILALVGGRTDGGRNRLSPAFVGMTFFALMIFAATDGLRDNARTLNPDNSADQAVQTYAAAQYLAERSAKEDVILKDHNYLSGDTWMKLFFMRGYDYPLSRGYFKRYEDNVTPREQCTNLMISLPNSPEAKKCFAGTQTNFILVDPKSDGAQFHRLDDFWQIYSSDEVGIFYKSS